MRENPVRLTTLPVVKKARSVKINRGQAGEFAKELICRGSEIPPWPKKMHLETRHEKRMLDYLIIVDTLNHCFWSKREMWHISYKNREWNGYYALSLAVKRFFEENPDRANFVYLSQIPYKEFLKILQGGGKLLLLKERYKNLRNICSVFVRAYGGDSEKFITLKDARNKCLAYIAKKQE